MGAAIRLAACFGAPLEIIEPCGFPLTDRAVKRTAMDYGNHAALIRHASLHAFATDPARREGRLVLIETDAPQSIYDFAFAPGDTLIFGRESAGSPPDLYRRADAAVRIPMAPGARSLNLVTAAAVALSEALRQIGAFAAPEDVG